jgi:hypothetical protein
MIKIVLHASKVFTTPIIVLVETPIYEKLESNPNPLIEFVAELVLGIVDELVAKVE